MSIDVLLAGSIVNPTDFALGGAVATLRALALSARATGGSFLHATSPTTKAPGMTAMTRPAIRMEAKFIGSPLYDRTPPAVSAKQRDHGARP
jgi:hypothetical protein